MKSRLRWHPQIALDLLFAVTARALQDLAGNPRRLGGQLGMLGVLHTWSRTLIFHPHVHYLIPGGGLSPDGRRWIPARKKVPAASHRPGRARSDPVQGTLAQGAP